MTSETKTSLEEVEPLDAAQYFGAIVAEVGTPLAASQHVPLYGLVEGRFPDATEPVDADNKRVVVAEDIYNAEDQGLRPALTVAFEQNDEPGDTEPEARAEILVDARSGGEIPNRLAETPVHAREIIKKAMRLYGLQRVTTTPESVAGLPSDRYLNAARFLLEAGFQKQDDGEGQGPVFELVDEEFEPLTDDVIDTLEDDGEPRAVEAEVETHETQTEVETAPLALAA